MRYLPLMLLTGCAGSAFELERDPTTGVITHAELRRSYLSGPVEASIEVRPDGTVIVCWQSDVQVVPPVDAGAIAEGVARGLSR